MSDLNKKCDESEEDSGANGDQRVGPHRQDVFLETNQVNENRPENETRQEHDRLWKQCNLTLLKHFKVKIISNNLLNCEAIRPNN
jgi:hypothetical protein